MPNLPAKGQAAWQAVPGAGAALAGLWALVLLAYANAMAGVFQFDDYNVIVDFAAVHSLAAWWVDAGQGIRPLLKLSYTLNQVLGGEAPGFHALNILIHGLTVGLVWRLSRHAVAVWAGGRASTHSAWLAAALFALHPAHTEAVTYISGRSTALMALLYLAGIWAHTVAPDRQRPWLVPLCFAAALATKETAVTFPLALLLWDRARGVPWRTSVGSARGSWAVLVVAACFFVWSEGYRAAIGRSLEFNSLVGNGATQVLGLLYLLRQWLLPLWPNIDPHLPVLQGLAATLLCAAVLLAVLMAVLLLRRVRPKPWLGFAVAWTLLHLLALYLVLPRLDVANERQLYLVGWPLGLALVWALQQALPPRWARGVLWVLLCGCAVLTVQRNHDYRSEVALWEQTARVSPLKSRVHNNLGYAYWQAGRADEARQAFLRALQLDAGNTKARLNLRRLNAERAAAPVHGMQLNAACQHAPQSEACSMAR